MGVRGLQSYILAKCPESLVPVELKASYGESKRRIIVVEGWSCLRSVYGPHMDFICGGQWQEFHASIRRFVNTFQQANCELVVFFQGGIEETMRAEWARRRSQGRDTVAMVMQGLRQRGHAPDRKHFLPNETHPQVFRQVLLSLHVKVISTKYSTDKAMVSYALENNAYGILANDSDFIMMNAPRYLSLHHLRLANNSIATMEFDREKVSASLDLPLSLFPLLSCLLGNDVVNYDGLEKFHKRLVDTTGDEENKKKEGVQLVMGVAEFIKGLPEALTDNIAESIVDIIKEVLPDISPEELAEWEVKFSAGLEQYCEEDEVEAEPSTSVVVEVLEKGKRGKKKSTSTKGGSEEEKKEDEDEKENVEVQENGEEETAVETEEVKVELNGDISPPGEVDIIGDKEELPDIGGLEIKDKVKEEVKEEVLDEVKDEVKDNVKDKVKDEVKDGVKDEVKDEVKVVVEEVPIVAQPEVSEETETSEKTEVSKEADIVNNDVTSDVEEISDVKSSETSDVEENGEEDTSEEEEGIKKLIGAVSDKVLSSALAAHTAGTLNTHLYPLMSDGTFSLGPLYEDVRDKDIIASAILFKPVRQRIYGLVFGVGLQLKDDKKKRGGNTKIDTYRHVTVKEYTVTGTRKQLFVPEEVPALPVHTCPNKVQPRRPTPHIERLWIGNSVKIQELRRGTLLAIMGANTASFSNPNVVANEYLLVALVLRYLLTSGHRVLREYELDAFLATALSPQLQIGPSHLYKLNPGARLTSRGCSLAHMFVQGVETALLANDACAYPLPRRFCFLGNFFDGKLFQQKLAQTRAGLSLLDLCDGELYAVDYLRRLRWVITEELPRSVFAAAPVPLMQAPVRGGRGRGGYNRGGYSKPPLMPGPPMSQVRGMYPPQGRGGQRGGYYNGAPLQYRAPTNYNLQDNSRGGESYDQVEYYNGEQYHEPQYNNNSNQVSPGVRQYQDTQQYPDHRDRRYKGYPGQQEDNQNYAKRGLPERTDTKQWINFLGN